MKNPFILSICFIIIVATLSTSTYTYEFSSLLPPNGSYTTFYESTSNSYESSSTTPTVIAARWDYYGDFDWQSTLCASVVFCEQVGDLYIEYALSSLLEKNISTTSMRFNIMVAYGDMTSIGYPYLDGWY